MSDLQDLNAPYGTVSRAFVDTIQHPKPLQLTFNSVIYLDPFADVGEDDNGAQPTGYIRKYYLNFAKH